MEILNRKISLDSFFESLKSATRRILMLDYDGTLSPFTPQRNHADPYPGIREILGRITETEATRLVIISGRELKILEPLLGLKKKPEMWGCHGAERYSPSDGYSAIGQPESTRRFVSTIVDWVHDNRLSDILEIKPFGIAFHWRGLPDARQNEIETVVESVWKNRVTEYDLEIRKFDGGIEIRDRRANKSRALKEILGEYQGDYAAAYLGDDYTDEDAFNALGDRGLKILVRTENRPTAADIILTPPEELLDFLNRWLNAAS